MEDGGLPAMASAALAELRKTARLEGAAIIDIARPDSASVLMFDAVPGVPDAIRARANPRLNGVKIYAVRKRVSVICQRCQKSMIDRAL